MFSGDLDSIKILVENGVDFMVGNDDLRTVIKWQSPIFLLVGWIVIIVFGSGGPSGCIKWYDQCLRLPISPGKPYQMLQWTAVVTFGTAGKIRNQSS